MHSKQLTVVSALYNSPWNMQRWAAHSAWNECCRSSSRPTPRSRVQNIKMLVLRKVLRIQHF